MTLNSYLDVEQGSTLNMAGYPLSAPSVYLGWGYNQPVSLLNRRSDHHRQSRCLRARSDLQSQPLGQRDQFQSQRRHVYAQQPSVHAEPLQWRAGDNDLGGQRELLRGPFRQQGADAGGLHDAQQRAHRAAIFDTGHGGLWTLLRRTSLLGSGGGQRAQSRPDYHRQPQCLCRGRDVQPQPLGQRLEFQFVRRHEHAQQPGLHADAFQRARRRRPRRAT